MNAAELHVLVPSPLGGLVVVDAADLVAALAEKAIDGELTENDLDDVLMDHGIESTLTARDDVDALVRRVRDLNRTGDVDEFWKAVER